MGTKDRRKVVIAGAGGQGSEANWIFNEHNKLNSAPFFWDVLGYIEDNTALHGQMRHGVPVLGAAESVVGNLGSDIFFHVAIGQNLLRKTISDRLSSLGLKPASAIHPAAVIASESFLGEGAFISALAVVGPYAEIGHHVIINASCGIGHHVKLGDFSQICPGARINGYCSVGELGFVGSNGCLNPGVKVGIRGVVGANSLAVNDVEDGVTVLGVPARPIHRVRGKN